jgi:hypothetical protein
VNVSLRNGDAAVTGNFHYRKRIHAE